MPPSWALSMILQSSSTAARVRRALRGSLRFGVYRVRNRLLESGLLLVIGTYVHYRYARVGSSKFTVGDRTYRDIVEYCEIVDGSWIVV